MKSNLTVSIDSEVLIEARMRLQNMSKEVESFLRERIAMTEEEGDNPELLKQKVAVLEAKLKSIKKEEEEREKRRVYL